MPKNALDEDFLENATLKFFYIGNLNRPDDTLHTTGGAIRVKNLEGRDTERFWMMRARVLDKQDYLGMRSNDFSDIVHGIGGQ